MSPRREDLGSWLEGTPGPSRPAGDGRRDALDLPSTGPGSRAGLGRRLAALAVDWLLSMLVSGAFFAQDDGVVPRVLAGDPVATLAVFGVSTAVMVTTLGHTIGHRALGLQVVSLRDLPRARGGAAVSPSAALPAPGLVAGLVRTALLCLVIPPAIWGADGRGMHDVAAGTAVVRR